MYERKPIPNFPDYFVDNEGNVFSKKRGSLIKMNPGGGIGEYNRVILYKSLKKYTRKVHSLVLETFLSKRPVGMECCHEDDNKKNNNLSNLRWDTRSNNMKDAVRLGSLKSGSEHHWSKQKGEDHPNSKLNWLKVRVIRALNGKMSQRKIAYFFCVSQVNIGSVIRNETWVV